MTSHNPRGTAAPISPDAITTIKREVEARSMSAIGRATGLHHSTIARALEGRPVSPTVALALGRIAPKTRKAPEFSAARILEIAAPRTRDVITSWDLSSIRSARDLQMQGKFMLPAKLAEAMRCDDAIYTARENRLAPIKAVRSSMQSAGGARGDAVLAKSKRLVRLTPGGMLGILGTLVDHGVAFGYLEHDPSEDGSELSVRLREWPIEAIEWRESERLYFANTDQSGWAPISHGDGRWVVFAEREIRPFANACLLPASFLWPQHAEPLADWAASARSHGLAKAVGELPEGYSLLDEEGNPTPEAAAFLGIMRGLMSGEAVAGVRPPGSKTEFLSNLSSAWQVFDSLIGSREKAAARVYLGTDAVLGAQGGAPGVDITQLFGVALTKVQGDFRTLEDAINTGVLAPWAAMNEGDSRYAPTFKFLLPDADAKAIKDERSEAWTKFLGIVKLARDAGVELTRDRVEQIASEHGIAL